MLLKFRRLSTLVASFAVPLWLSFPLAANAEGDDATANRTEVQEQCSCPCMDDFDEFYWGWYENDTCPESLGLAAGEDRCCESVATAESELDDPATAQDAPASPVPQDADYWYDSETGDYHTYEFAEAPSPQECVAKPVVAQAAATALDAEGCPLVETSDDAVVEFVSEEDMEPWPASIPSYDEQYAYDCGYPNDAAEPQIAEACDGDDDWEVCHQGYCADWCDCDAEIQAGDSPADEVVELTCDEPAFDGDAHRDAVYREYQWYYELEESFEQVADAAEARDDDPQGDAEAAVTEEEVAVDAERDGDYLDEYEAYVNQDAQEQSEETAYEYDVDGEFDEGTSDAATAYDDLYAVDDSWDYEAWYGYEDEVEDYACDDVDQLEASGEMPVEPTEAPDVAEADVAEAVEPEAAEPEAVEPEVEPEVVEPEAVEPEVVEPEAVEPEAAPPEMDQRRATLRTIARTLDRVGRSLQGLSQHLDRLAGEQVAQHPGSDAALQR
jgi:hypothetical protein